MNPNTEMAIIDLLVNSLDKCGPEEMVDFLVNEYNLELVRTQVLVELFIKKFSTVAIPMNDDCLELLRRVIN